MRIASALLACVLLMTSCASQAANEEEAQQKEEFFSAWFQYVVDFDEKILDFYEPILNAQTVQKVETIYLSEETLETVDELTTILDEMQAFLTEWGFSDFGMTETFCDDVAQISLDRESLQEYGVPADTTEPKQMMMPPRVSIVRLQNDYAGVLENLADPNFEFKNILWPGEYP